jgi:crotonobetaine/carnitine-CoA ligase
MLAYHLQQSNSVAVVLDQSFMERVAEVQPECPLLQFICIVPDDSKNTKINTHFKNTPAIWWPEISNHSPLDENFKGPQYSDLLQILYSSGTTGLAKGTMIANASAIRAAEKHVEVFGYDSTDVMHTCLPMFHANAINCTIFPALIAGASVALSPRFSASGFWAEINACKATRTSMLGAMINFLWLRPESAEERSHHLKTCLVVPAPSFGVEFERRFNVVITSLYGIGDFGYVSMLGPNDPREKIGSAGRILPEVSISILDDDDLPVPDGEVGQICLRSNEAWFGRQGYYNLPERWISVIRNLWLHTGERGRIDPEGYLYFDGRSKDLIRRRGENISSVQIENIIRRHPSVADVAVYAVRAEFLEDEVMTSIVCKDGHTLDHKELIEFCAPQMAYFMVPRFVEFLPQLPLTPTGKIETYKLREAAQQRLAEVWDREKHGIKLEK